MDITYQWIRSRRKTIAIQIDRNGQVILRTPYGITKRQAEKFLDEKKDWILKTIRQVENRKTDQIMIGKNSVGKESSGRNGFFRNEQHILL